MLPSNGSVFWAAREAMHTGHFLPVPQCIMPLASAQKCGGAETAGRSVANAHGRLQAHRYRVSGLHSGPMDEVPGVVQLLPGQSALLGFVSSWGWGALGSSGWADSSSPQSGNLCLSWTLPFGPRGPESPHLQ